LFARRFLALIFLVASINSTWHFLRAWVPLFLQKIHGYSQDNTNDLTVAYYISADIGALSAGAVTLWLARNGVGVHTSRALVYLVCSLLCGLCAAIPFLDGPYLVAAFLLVGFGSLGVFPCYYSFTQDLSERHQGKISGTLGFLAWVILAGWQWLIGQLVHATGSYTAPFVISAVFPLAGFVALSVLWGSDARPETPPPPPDGVRHASNSIQR
jgi:ACS family hexuronate transporter-like MFS transporter